MDTTAASLKAGDRYRWNGDIQRADETVLSAKTLDTHLDAVALTLNTRPRKTLNWQTPAEAHNEHLRSAQQDSVATTS